MNRLEPYSATDGVTGELPILWWVTDQLPYPPRNGVTLPSFHHAQALAGRSRLRLVLLQDADAPPKASALQENEERFGPILVLKLRRAKSLHRLLAELAGREMFQHGFLSAEAANLQGWQTGVEDRLLVTPISAVAKLRALAPELPSRLERSAALVSDCTAGEYYFRGQERAGNWRHRLKGWLDRWRSAGIGRIEADLLDGYRAILLQTPRDREIFVDLVGPNLAEQVSLLPNGVNDDLFGLALNPAAHVIFMAELSGEYGPIAEWLVGAVWPKVQSGDFKLHIVGRGAGADLRALMVSTPGVIHSEFVPDLSQVYQSAALAISPVFKGFGLINKTLEAMAAGVAVVGGLAAFNGIAGFTGGRHGWVCDRPDTEEFARALSVLLQDGERRQAMARQGQALVSAGFRWAPRSEQLAELLELPASDAQASPNHERVQT